MIYTKRPSRNLSVARVTASSSRDHAPDPVEHRPPSGSGRRDSRDRPSRREGDRRSDERDKDKGRGKPPRPGQEDKKRDTLPRSRRRRE